MALTALNTLDKVIVKWSQPTDTNIEYYDVYRRQDGVTASITTADIVAKVGYGHTQYVDILSAGGTVQHYWVKAISWSRKSSAFSATICANISSTSLGLFGVMGEPTGFPNRTCSVITWNDGTRTFSISPAGTYFTYYISGEKFIVTAAKTVQPTNTSGTSYIYFDSGTLTSTAGYTSDELSTVIESKALVAAVYWNTATQSACYYADERHGLSMDGVTHRIHHFIEGFEVREGGAIESITADSSGALDEHAQFGTTAAVFFDEDITVSAAAVASTTGFQVVYRSGADGNWVRTSVTTALPVLYLSGGRTYYNEWTGATWQLTEVINNQFCLYHVFGSNDVNYPIVTVPGQNNYSTLTLAREGAASEITTILGGSIPTHEIVPLATVIYQSSNAYGNEPKARIRSIDASHDWIDWREQNLTPGAGGVNDHGSLAGLADDDHAQYLNINGRGGQVVDDSITICGATTLHSTLDVTAGLTTLHGLQFDLNASSSLTGAEGRLVWNGDDGTLNLGMPGGTVNIQLGQEHVIRAKNDQSAAISNGQIVYISSGTGTFAAVALADATTFPKAFAIAIATEDVADGNFGYFTTHGLVRDLNTSGMGAGSPLFLDPATPGGFTTTYTPATAGYTIGVGYVVRDHLNEGIILFRSIIIPRLFGLSDVEHCAATTEGQFIRYDATEGIYRHQNLSLFETAAGTTTLEGNLVPTADNTRVLGASGTRFAGLHVVSAEISSLNVTANASVSGTFHVSGAATFGSTVAICGVTTINAATRIGANLSSSGTFHASGVATFGNSILVCSNSTYSGGLLVCAGFTAKGVSNLHSTLAVCGSTTVSGGLVSCAGFTTRGVANFESAVSCKTTLHVSGATTLGSTLTVSGATTINNSLTASSLSVTAAASVQTTLHVSGATTLGSTLTVSGEGTFNDGATVHSALNVKDFIEITAQTSHPAAPDSGIRIYSQVTGGITKLMYKDSAGTTYQLDEGGGYGVYIEGDGAPAIDNTAADEYLVFDSTQFDITVNGQCATVTLAGAQVFESLTICGNLTVSGLTTLTGNVSCSGTLHVSGAVTFGDTLTVSSNTTINGQLTVLTGSIFNAGVAISGSCTIAAGLVVSGATTLGSTVTISGDTSINNTLDVSGVTTLHSGLTVCGNTTLTSGVALHSTLSVSGATSLGDSLTVSGATSINNSLAVTGTLTVDGATTINDTLGVSGATTLHNTLHASGATTLGSTLTVSGATTINNTLHASGNTTIGGTLTVSGATTLSSSLHVSGNTTIDGTLGVCGTATFESAVYVNAGLRVSGITTLMDSVTICSATTINNILSVSGVVSMRSNVCAGGTFHASGATTLGSTLAVCGATTLRSTLAVSGATTINNSLGISGALTLRNGAVIDNTAAGTITMTGNIVATVGNTYHVGDHDLPYSYVEALSFKCISLDDLNAYELTVCAAGNWYLEGDLLPSTTLTEDLGKTGNRWNNAWIRTLNLNTNSGFASTADGTITVNGDLVLTAVASHNIGSTTTVWNNLFIRFISGSGNNTVLDLTFSGYATFQEDVVPNAVGTLNLGGAGIEWLTTYTQNIVNNAGTVTIDSSNLTVDGDLVVTGATTIHGGLTVSGNASICNHLGVCGASSTSNITTIQGTFVGNSGVLGGLNIGSIIAPSAAAASGRAYGLGGYLILGNTNIQAMDCKGLEFGTWTNSTVAQVTSVFGADIWGWGGFNATGNFSTVYGAYFSTFSRLNYNSTWSATTTYAVYIADSINATGCTASSATLLYVEPCDNTFTTAANRYQVVLGGTGTAMGTGLYLGGTGGIRLNNVGGGNLGISSICASGTSGTVVHWGAPTATRGNVLYRYTSSRRYKYNITEFKSQWDDILKVQPKKYSNREGDKWDIGYIAEDFDDIGLIDLVQYDEKGRPDSIKYDRLSLYLIEVVRELRNEVQELKRQVQETKETKKDKG